MNKQKLGNRDKPIIGIVPLVDLQRESYWMLPGYMKGIELAGGFPVMLPLTSEDEDILQMVRLCDGILFTGGQDVEPQVYCRSGISSQKMLCLGGTVASGVLFYEGSG